MIWKLKQIYVNGYVELKNVRINRRQTFWVIAKSMAKKTRERDIKEELKIKIQQLIFRAKQQSHINTVQKMKFSTEDFFSKCDQISLK